MRTIQPKGRGIGSVRAFGLVSAFLLAVAPVAHAQSGAPVHTGTKSATVEARNKATVQAAFATWRAGGDIFARLLAPDIVWTIRGSGPIAGTYRGLKDFTQRASAPLISRLSGPLTPVVRRIWAEGDVVIVRFDGSAMTTSGASYRNQFVWILRMNRGRAVEAEAFLDLVAYQKVIEDNEPRAR